MTSENEETSEPSEEESSTGDAEEESEQEETPEEQESEDREEHQQDQSSDQQDDDHGGGESEAEFEEEVVHVNRCCKVVRGGKRFSFSALVVAGNRQGKISWGFGKGNQVPDAIEKAINDSRRRVIDVPLVGGTIPHQVTQEYCATELLLRPASAGTGVIASLPVRTVARLTGVTDLLTKIQGSTNPLNTVKATYEGFKSLRSKERIEELRDVQIT